MYCDYSLLLYHPTYIVLASCISIFLYVKLESLIINGVLKATTQRGVESVSIRERTLNIFGPSSRILVNLLFVASSLSKSLSFRCFRLPRALSLSHSTVLVLMDTGVIKFWGPRENGDPPSPSSTGFGGPF